jgi:HD-GYP domain-containing protein (c-di-GMP phosphodiesterase class II)
MAIQIMKEARGVFFDPKLLDIFLDNLADVYAIQEKYKDTNNPDDDKLSF